MQQDLPADEFAANMYSIYRFQLDEKLYKTPEEKAEMENELQSYEEYYLKVQEKSPILIEIGFTPIHPPGGPPPPPVF